MKHCFLSLRYIDAARCFNTVLAYINRTKQYHVRSVQYDQVCLCSGCGSDLTFPRSEAQLLHTFPSQDSSLAHHFVCTNSEEERADACPAHPLHHT